MLGIKIHTLLEVSREAKLPLLVGTVILVFLSIFTKCQASPVAVQYLEPRQTFGDRHLETVRRGR